MGLLDRLLGSDSNLKRPRFEYAPSVELYLAPCSVKFKNPDHTAMYPINVFPENFDLFDNDQYELQDAGDYVKLFYVRGWDLFGRKNIAKGGVGITGRIFYFPDQFKKNLNFIEMKCFHDTLLYVCHDSWGYHNEGAILGSIGNGSYKYPLKLEDFSNININNTNWTHFQAGIDGHPPKVIYTVALTKQHMLYFEFTLSAYRGLDFYSPETNMKEAAFGVVDEFMSHVEISRNGTA